MGSHRINRHYFNEIPPELAEFFEFYIKQSEKSGLDVYRGLQNVLYPDFSEDRRIHEAYNYDLNLKTPWQGYSAIRIIFNTHDRKIHVFFKKEEGSYRHIFLQSQNEYDRIGNILNKITTPRKLHWTDYDHIHETSYWSGLQVYHASEGLAESYDKQNKATAEILYEKIQEGGSEDRPIYVIDLGCGIGKINQYYQECVNSKAHSKTVNWIGVDFNADSIRLAKQEHQNGIWVQADALDFIKNPIKYLEKDVANELRQGDVYVVSSGLLTQNVLTIEQSLEIAHQLRRYPNLKLFAVTGLHPLYVSPYIAKQMGFKRVEMAPADSQSKLEFTMNLLGFEKISDSKLKERILLKARKYKMIDFSFIQNPALLDDVDPQFFKHIDTVMLTGVELNQGFMDRFDRWVQVNPKLAFILSSTDQEKLERNFVMIENSNCRNNFLCAQVMKYTPRFSPHFMRKIDSYTREDLPLYDGNDRFDSMLRLLLLRALVQDDSPQTPEVQAAKKIIHLLLNNQKIDNSVLNNTDAILKYSREAGIREDSDLYFNLEMYLRLSNGTDFTERAEEILTNIYGGDPDFIHEFEYDAITEKIYRGRSALANSAHDDSDSEFDTDYETDVDKKSSPRRSQ